MTTPNIEEMEAGRELNQRIAAEIFDWSDFWTDGVVLYGLSPDERRMGIDAERGPVPNFSEDIADAWLIVDKLMESNFMISVSGSHESGWWCVIYGASGPAIEGPYADTAPLAICRAALKALEAQP